MKMYIHLISSTCCLLAILGEYEREILEETQRRNQEARGDDVEIPDDTEDSGPRVQNPYYTDEDEPYSPPNSYLFTRRMSDSSVEENVEEERLDNMTEEVLRGMHEDLNQTGGQEKESDCDLSANPPSHNGIF